MAIPDSSTHLRCNSCGTAWSKTDDEARYWFKSSSTYSIGDYASPKDISDAAETIEYCPSDNSRGRQKRLTADMNESEMPNDVALERTPPRETASQGEADVSHTGSIS